MYLFSWVSTKEEVYRRSLELKGSLALKFEFVNKIHVLKFSIDRVQKGKDQVVKGSQCYTTNQEYTRSTTKWTKIETKDNIEQ